MANLVPLGTQPMAQIWYAHDVVRCRRKIFALAPTFEIFDLQGTPLVYCQEKLFRIKDDIRVYQDSSKSVELLRIKQRNIMDWAGVFDVTDPATGQRLGALRRKGWRSFLRDEWHILDAYDRQVGVILETGPAWLRRIFKFLPYSFALSLSGQAAGTFDQHFSLVTYQATMTLGAWPAGTIDRRMAFAAALLLMAVEAKEDANR
jgi:hypothetical protein